MIDLTNIKASNGSGEAVRALVTVIRSAASTVLTPNSLVNWPNEFIATTGPLLANGSLDPVKTIVFKGHIDGTDIIIDELAPGYVDTYGSAVGDVVVVKPTSLWADIIADALEERQEDSVLNLQDTTGGGDFIVRGTGVITVSSGITGAISDIIYYIDGIRYAKTGISNKTFTASKRTYVYINAAGVITYSETALADAMPATPVGAVLWGCVTTNATVIASITHYSQGANADGWEEISTTNVTLANNTLVINLPKQKRFMKVVFMMDGFSAAVTNIYMRLNDVSTAIHGGRVTTLGTGYATTAITNGTYIQLYPGGVWPRHFSGEIDIVRPQPSSGLSVMSDSTIVAGDVVASAVAARILSDYSIFQNPFPAITSLSFFVSGANFVGSGRFVVLGRD